MSFQNYDNFPQQGQQGDVGAGPGGPPQQDQNMGGQIPPNSAGGFQGGNGGDPGSAGGQAQGGDAKTTLWYDAFSFWLWLYQSTWPFDHTLLQFFRGAALVVSLCAVKADDGTGWASLSPGSTKILCEQFGTIWVSKSM